MDFMQLEPRFLPINGNFPSSNDMKSMYIYFIYLAAKTNYYKPIYYQLNDYLKGIITA